MELSLKYAVVLQCNEERPCDADRPAVERLVDPEIALEKQKAFGKEFGTLVIRCAFRCCWRGGDVTHAGLPW